MRHLRIIGGGVALVLLLAACGQMADVGPSGNGPSAVASAPISSMAEAVPVIIDGANRGGNRTCEEVGVHFGTTFEFSSARVNYEDDMFEGAFPAGLSVSTDGTFVSFTSTFPIGAVIVKGSNAANVYYYPEGIFADTGLSSPDNASGSPAGLSNITFCWNAPDDEPELKPLKVTKTAYTKHRQRWDWDIDKSAMQDYVYAGAEALFEVVLTPSGPVSLFEVRGSITVHNPNDEATAVVTSVTDMLSFAEGEEEALDVACSVDLSEPFTLAAGESFTCSYEYSGTRKPIKNTATAVVSDDSDVEGASGFVYIEFAAHWGEIEPGVDYGSTNFCVDVIDNMGDEDLRLQEQYLRLATLCINDNGTPSFLDDRVEHTVDNGSRVLRYSIPTMAPVHSTENVVDVTPTCGDQDVLRNRAKVLLFGGYKDAIVELPIVSPCEGEKVKASLD